jgi:N-acetylmuramoyl-L-alanine amidase
MRKIKYIVLHCTATHQNATVSGILRYWREDLKWKNPGYHYLISKDGEIHHIHDINKIANGVKGYNAESIHISYIGGIDNNNKPLDNRTPEQIKSQIRLIDLLKEQYPDAEILGHRDFPGVKKSCPSFDVRTWLKCIGY